MPVSAQEGLNLERVEAELRRLLPEGPTTPVRLAPPVLNLALAGRVNVGKSSIVNALLKQDRMIVSEVPGTTRDSVDIRFEKDGQAFVIIDTAGIRKEKAVQNSLEFYAKRRSERAMRRADVTALVIDATFDVSRIDRTIAGYAIAAHHPVVVVVNKWDLAPPGFDKATFVKYLAKTLNGMPFAPILFTSAIHGRNVSKIVDVAHRLHVQAQTRVSTADVNKAIERRLRAARPRAYEGSVGKIYYGTQVEVSPPTFVLFVDDPARFEDAYTRYLENRFREMLPFPEVPCSINYKSRMRSPSKNALGPEAQEELVGGGPARPGDAHESSWIPIPRGGGAPPLRGLRTRQARRTAAARGRRGAAGAGRGTRSSTRAARTRPASIPPRRPTASRRSSSRTSTTRWCASGTAPPTIEPALATSWKARRRPPRHDLRRCART